MKICPRLELVSIAKAFLIALCLISQTKMSAQDCIYVDFTYTIGVNGEVTFKDISSSPNTNTSSWTWTWDLGDGAIVTSQNPVHRYNIANSTDPTVCFDVTLTVFDGTATGVSEPKHICIPTTTRSGGNGLYVQILSPRPIYDSPCNKNWAKAITLQETRFEGSVLGGTPPYRFDWDVRGANTMPSVISGPGPHYVTFTTPTSGGSGICSREGTINLTVTDANNVQGTAYVRLNVRNVNDEGPGTLKIVCNKTTPCESEEVSLTVKAQDPFGFVWPETYKWFIDNQEQPDIFRKIKRRFTAGSHTIRVEVTDGGGSVIRNIPQLVLTVSTAQECNMPGTTRPKFKILVNDRTDGSIPLVLEAAKPCSYDDNIIDPATNGKTSKIKIVVPNLGSAADRNNSLLRQAPDYFFQFQVEYNGVKKGLHIAGGYGPLGNIITEKWLITNGYLPKVNGSSLEYPVPLCFTDCPLPLYGNSRLVVSVGRYAQSPVAIQCVAEATLPPIDIKNACSTSGVGYFENNCIAFIQGMTNEDLDVQVCHNPIGIGRACACTTVSEKILQGEVVREMQTGYYDIFVKHDDPPLSITEIKGETMCGSNDLTLSPTISGGVTKVIDLDLRNPFFCSQATADYKYNWQIFDYYNPTREIGTDIFSSLNNTKTPKINLNHPYFNVFTANDDKLFIAQVTVIDIAGNRMTYAQVVIIPPPLTITLTSTINRCSSSTNTPLSNTPIVTGGKPPYTYSWTGGIVSSNENPVLNFNGLMTPISTTLSVTDGVGCSVSKTITIAPVSLSPISLGNSPIIACANSSSVKTIGPINATNQRDLENNLGGSGEYSYRWTATTTEGLDKLSDPTIPYPIVIGTMGTSVDYILTITDLNGGCSTSSSSKLTVQGSNPVFNVALPTDKTLCAGNGNSVTLEAITKSSPKSGLSFTYQWTSDAPDFISNSTTNTLILNNIRSGSRNTYTVTAIDNQYGCSSKDDIVVEMRKDWTFKGYETVIAPIQLGTSAPLWATDDNAIFVNNSYNSGAQPNFTTNIPSGVSLTDVQFTPDNVIKQAKWTPVPYSQYSIPINVTDNVGCKKDFPSNTYYFLAKEPQVTVSTDKKVVCNGGSICLYFSLKLNIIGETKNLPTSFSVKYDVKRAILRDNGIWDYFDFSNPPAGTKGDIEFVLTNASLGLYSAVTCLKNTPNISGGPGYLAFLVNSGLPNFMTTNSGKIKIAYQFKVSPIQDITQYNWIWGEKSTPQQRQFGYRVVGLGTSVTYDRRGFTISPSSLIIRDAAFAEYSAGRGGQVLVEHNVDIRENTNYFHAFIDPCITEAKTFANNGESIVSTLKPPMGIPKDLSGVFNAFPNPFSNDITLNYEVRSEKGSTISLNVYNSFGQLIDRIYDNRFHPFGVFSTVYDTEKLTSGIYIFELTMDGEKLIRKSMKVN